MDWTPVTQIVIPSAVVSAFITAAINHFFETRRNKESRLFDTKRSVYADVVSTIHYPFQKDGMTTKQFDEIVRAVSAARILAGKDLRGLLDDMFDLSDQIEQEDDAKARKKLIGSISPLRIKIETAMRKELGVG